MSEENKLPEFDGKVTINGTDYKLGDIFASDENAAFFRMISKIENVIEMMQNEVFFEDFKRVLREAITSGENAEKADEAIKGMPLKVSSLDAIYDKLILSILQ